MLHFLIRAARGATLVSVMTLLASCGGGGGGGSGGSNGGGATVTGLVPTASPPGATLYARGADLRPLRDGATWTYRSADRLNGVYGETTLRQAAGSGGRMVETDSSDPGATATVGIDTSGAVLFSTRLDLGDGLPTLSAARVRCLGSGR